MTIVEPTELCDLRADVERLRAALAELRLERDSVFRQVQSDSTPELKKLDAMIRYSELTGDMRDLCNKLDHATKNA